MSIINRPSAGVIIIASLLLVMETGCRKTTPTAKKCTKDTDCGQGSICVAGVCRPRKGSCRTSSNCPKGAVCREHRCQDCQKHSECGSGRCVRGKCQEAMTGTCREDDDCRDEEVCRSGRCVASPRPYTGPALCRLQPVLFSFNKAEISLSAQKALEKNAQCIRRIKSRKVHLEGHCDPRGTEEYNLALSNRRAQAAKRYLEHLGIKGARLHVIPKGELEARGTDEAGWARDRRVEFIWY